MSQALGTPLQLKGFWLTKVELEVNESYDSASEEQGFNLGFGLELSSAIENENLHKVTMLVDLEKKEDGSSPYSGCVQAEGMFSIPDSTEESMDLVRYNGSSQLYGFIRSELYGLTLKFPHAPILLPSVNLVPLIEALEEDCDIEE